MGQALATVTLAIVMWRTSDRGRHLRRSPNRPGQDLRR